MAQFWKKKKPKPEPAKDDAAAPGMVIPDFKGNKKEEEKKKGAIPLAPGGQAGQGFAGAKGGAGLAARLGLGKGVTIGQFLGTAFGKILVSVMALGFASVVMINGIDMPPPRQDAPPTPHILKAARRIGAMMRQGSSAVMKNVPTGGGLFGWGRKAGDSASSEGSAAGEAGEAGDPGSAEDVEGSVLGGPTDGTGPAGSMRRLKGGIGGATLGSTKSDGVSGANFAFEGPEYGKTLGVNLKKFNKGQSGSASAFDGQTGAKGTPAMLRKREVAGRGGMGRIRRMDRNSRSLARLRAMSPLSVKMSQGATASEANSADALEQFTNTEQAGGTAPAGPDDGSVNPTDVSGGGGGGESCACNFEAGEVCVQGACQPAPGYNEVEVTPWADEVQEAKENEGYIVILMVLGAIFATIAYELKDKAAPYGTVVAAIFWILAIVAALAAVALCIKNITLANKIKHEGGQPQDRQVRDVAITYMVGIVLMAALALVVRAAESSVTIMAGVLAAAMIISGLVASQLSK